MNWLKKKKTKAIPDGYSAEDIKIESSICTGEKTIGFYDKKRNKLICAELVKSDEDIKLFYSKFGLNQK